MRALVVVNLRATATTELQRDVLAHALGGVADLQVEPTQNRGHAAALACRAMRDGVDVVVALGGDGTVNEVVNGLLTDGVHAAIPALGVVPAGSTNVFARNIGLPNDPLEATGVLLDAMRQGRRRRISLGQAEERWFLFTAGFGFDAAIIARVEKDRRRGRPASDALYARAGLREFLTTDRRHPRLRLEFPDAAPVDGVHMVVVNNTDPWTYLGNRALRMTPQATFDGGLDIYARTRMGTPGVLYSMAQLARRHPRSPGPGALVLHDVADLVARADTPLLLQVDGDLLGPAQTVRFRSHPKAIDVLV